MIAYLWRLTWTSNAGHVEIKDDINQKPVANNEQDAGNSGTSAPPVGKAKVIGHPYDMSHKSNYSSNEKLEATMNSS
jgi:hypothetical protein